MQGRRIFGCWGNCWIKDNIIKELFSGGWKRAFYYLYFITAHTPTLLPAPFLQLYVQEKMNKLIQE